MKTFRLWLLLLLAVLVPVRGALAIGMPCSGAAPKVVAQAAPSAHGHGHHLSDSHAGHHELSAHAHPDGTAGDHRAGEADKCNLCAASCAAAALLGASAGWAGPQRVAAEFPHLHAPPPDFVPDGQERPPRSI